PAPNPTYIGCPVAVEWNASIPQGVLGEASILSAMSVGGFAGVWFCPSVPSLYVYQKPVRIGVPCLIITAETCSQSEMTSDNVPPGAAVIAQLRAPPAPVAPPVPVEPPVPPAEPPVP